MSSSSDKFDPYDILGVSRNATDDEINKAFKEKSRIYHPDRPGGGDAVKFGQCSKAKNMLVDRQKRRIFDMGGWDAVNQQDQMQQARAARQMKCEPVNIRLQVTLEQIYRQDSVPIKATLPENSGEFTLDLKLDPGMLGHGVCVEHRGIAREDYITGDVIIHVEMKPGCPFKVQGLDLIMEIKMSLGDLLGYGIQIDHPSGDVYSITGKYENPDKQGNIVKYFPKMGLKGGDDTGNMIIVISPDMSSLTKLSKKTIQEIQALLGDTRKYASSSVSTKAIDITEKSASQRQMRQMSGFPPGIQIMGSMNGIPFPMPGMGGGMPGMGGPGDCAMQ
jgi:DnaJ-class molecular chaperone